jgi:hypothetical protein
MAEGLYEPLVMFFGLTNSPATFQAMMNTLFRTLIASGDLMVYMDDMAIHTGRNKGETEEEHIRRHRKIVNEVLTILEENNLYLNIDKCEFEQDHIDFLGVHVENNQLKMEEGKIDKVKNWTPPKNLREVRRFLGFMGYYRYFIKGYSVITKPLLELTKQSTPWHWVSPDPHLKVGEGQYRDRVLGVPLKPLKTVSTVATNTTTPPCAPPPLRSRGAPTAAATVTALCNALTSSHKRSTIRRASRQILSRYLQSLRKARPLLAATQSVRSSLYHGGQESLGPN